MQENLFGAYVMSCPNGGLLIKRHNKICDMIIHLAKQYLPPNCVSGENLIHQGRRRSDKELCHRGSVPQTRGDVSTRGLTERHMEEIIDVRFGDDDSYY